MDFQNIKKDFPFFKYNKDLIYFDNAATTHKPVQVLNSLNEFYSKYNSNVHRGLYPLSIKATELYEEARKIIAKFINAEPEEIIFTASATDSVNQLAQMLQVDTNLILLTELEHHSNLVPWQQSINDGIAYLPVNNDFGVEFNKSKITDNWILNAINAYNIFSFGYVSNVTGSITNAKKVISEYKKKNSYTVIDAAQAVGRVNIDVKDLDVDFLYFSGHKMFGPTGIGILYGKKEILNELTPHKTGGGMIRQVKKETSTWADLPDKFEAGTPNVADAIGLACAANYIDQLGIDNIIEYENSLRVHLYNSLKEIDEVKIYHPLLDNNAAPIVSFSVDGVHPHDIAEFLGQKNICVRAGHHCTQVLHRDVLQIPASVRASLSIYNNIAEINELVKVLKQAIVEFKR